MTDQLDAYKILQVDAEAEDEVIQAAYRRLARKYHPDMIGSGELKGRMEAINAAWALIGTPAARAAYDLERAPTTREEGAKAGASEPASWSTTGRTGAGARSTGPADPTEPGAAPGRPGERPAAAPPPPETVSRDWTSGRSTHGGGFDASMRAEQGLGAAGPPPGRPSGSVLNFGRFNGWSLGEIARRDIEYIEWLDRSPIGRTYREEIDSILRAAGRRRSADADSTERRGLFRRR